MLQSKATRAQLKQHNQRLILKAIYQEIALTRAALSQETGLAKPTVSDIVAELMSLGFIEETGHGSSTTAGGKRPRLLQFVPTARQIVSVCITPETITGCLAYLDGVTVAQHHLLRQDHDDLPLLTLLESVINALIVQADAPLLCLSIGVPGTVDNEAGIVISSPSLNWQNVPLVSHLETIYDLSTHLSNNTELVARAQITSSDVATRHLVTVLMGNTIEIGIAYDYEVFHHGSSLEQLTLNPAVKPVSFLRWRSIRDRALELRKQYPDSLLPASRVSYLHIRYAAEHGDMAANLLLDEVTATLAELYQWIMSLMRPDEIALAGDISDLGDMLTERIMQSLQMTRSERELSLLRLTLAGTENLSLIGAVAYALQAELGIL